MFLILKKFPLKDISYLESLFVSWHISILLWHIISLKSKIFSRNSTL